MPSELSPTEQRRTDLSPTEPSPTEPAGHPSAATRPDLNRVSATQPLPIVRPRPGSEADPGPVAPADPGPDRARWLQTLVGQALDDVDEGRMPVRDALRLVAQLAWRDGREHAGH